MNFLILFHRLAFILVGCRAQSTIRDLINARPELSTVRNQLQGTDAIEKLGSSTAQFTFFAPHNNAYAGIAAPIQSQLNSMNRQVANQLYLYHTVGSLFQTTSVSAAGSTLRLQSLANNGPMYMFFYKSDVEFINGARFIEKDLVATNGVLHIIDSIFVTLDLAPNTFRGNIDSYIDNQQQAGSNEEKTSLFNGLLDKYDQYMSSRMIAAGPYGSLVDRVLKNSSALVTAFIPTDAAIARFQLENPDRYRDLTTGAAAILQQVMEAHFIPIGAYHSNLLTDLSSAVMIPAMQGRIRMYRNGGSVYVSNNCGAAMVTKANTTMDNGVAYFIDYIIGYIVNDLYTQIQRDNGIPDFRGTLQSAPSSFQSIFQLPAGVADLPDDKKFTIFAPNTEAFIGNDFSQDPGRRSLELNMTVLPGVISLYQMVNGTQRPTLANGYTAKFSQSSDGIYVDVDYVTAKIVQADICTKNGIIHKVNKILGVPSRTIYAEIETNLKMTFLETATINTGLKSLLQDTSRDMTMFAPNDEAFARMTADSPAYSNRQNESKLKNILLRHVGRGTLFLDQIVPINGETTIETYNGQIRIGNQNNAYYILVGSQRINILRANLRMKNGVMHEVDKVLYDPNDPRTAESISNGNSLVPYLYVVLDLCLMSLFLLPV